MPDFVDPDTLTHLLHLAVAMGIGFLIGFEREYAHKAEAKTHSFAGARTFSLTGFAGALAGLADGGVVIPAMTLAAIGLLTAASYWSIARETPAAGGTTEIALFVTFLLGLAVMRGFVLEAVAGGVVTAMLLSLKTNVQRWAAALNEEEVSAALRFLVIALVILPVLPDENFGPYDALNLRSIWLMVVFISGLSFLGYWLIKLVGEGHGVLLTGLAGGLASSTATTLSLARFAKDGAGARNIAAGIVAANVVMLARVGLLVAAISREVLAVIAPALAAGAAVGIAAALWFWLGRKPDAQTGGTLDFGNPMEVRPALFFAGLLAVISLAASFAAEQFGNAGLFAVGLLSGLADVDAITLIAGQKAAAGSAAAGAAAAAILAAVGANICGKAVMAAGIAGGRVGVPVAAAFGAIMLAGAGVLVLTAG